MNSRGQSSMRSQPRSIRILLTLSLIATSTSFQPSPRLRGIARLHPQSTSLEQIAARRKRRPPQHHAASSLDAITPAAALSAVASPVGSLSVLAFVILVHEAGHFLAARVLGMQVDEFSVGVGPRLVGVRRRRQDGAFVWEKITDEKDGVDAAEKIEDGIEFSLRALPVGGYVRFPDNYNRTLAFEQDDVARRARNEARLMRLEDSSELEKALEAIAARSALLNVFSLGLLKRWQARREEDQLRDAELNAATESVGMGKATAGRSWWKAWPWGAKKEDTNAEFDGSERLAILQAAKPPAVAYYDDPDLLQNRPWPERSLVLSGGVIFNILLAFACYFGEVTGGRGLPVPVFNTGAVVRQVPGADSPSFGLLKQGDIIVGVNGRIAAAAASASDVSASQRQISTFISTIRETPAGESVKLTIIHGKDTQETDVVSVAPRINDDGLVSIGVMLGPNYQRTDMVRASSAADGVAKAAAAVYELTAQTASSIVGLLVGLVSGRGLPPGASMSGPIGVVRSGADIVRRSDLSAVVAFAASISINLAVVNALPLPALDGGQLAFVLAEAAAGRRIDQRLQEGINAGALFVLLAFSLSTAVGDVTSIFK